jgi:hypothetical protein
MSSDTTRDGTLIMRGKLEIKEAQVCADCKNGMVGKLIRILPANPEAIFRHVPDEWVDEELMPFDGKTVTIIVVSEVAR